MILHKRSHACAPLCHVTLDGQQVDFFHAVEGKDGFVAFTKDLPCGGHEVHVEHGCVEVQLDPNAPPWAREWFEGDERDNLQLMFKGSESMPPVGCVIPVYTCINVGLGSDETSAVARTRQRQTWLQLMKHPDPIGSARVRMVQADVVLCSVDFADTARARYIQAAAAGFRWNLAMVADEFEITLALDTLFNMWRTHHHCEHDIDDDDD